MWARTGVVAAAIAALALVPWSDNPLYRLAGGDGDGRDPTFDAELDARALRVFGDSHENGTYFLDASGATPLEQGNAKAAAQLLVPRLLPVLDPARADYLVQLVGKRFVAGPR